jgi:hypothetical protein
MGQGLEDVSVRMRDDGRYGAGEPLDVFQVLGFPESGIGVPTGPWFFLDDRGVIFGSCGLERRVAMRRRTIAFELACLATLWLGHRPAARAESMTPLQTQSTTAAGVLTSTNWGPGTSGITDPLVFDQFNSKLGTLDSVVMTLTATVRNDYLLVFPNTIEATRLIVADTGNSSVLTDSTELAKQTDGPTVTVFAPDHKTQIFGAPGTMQPISSIDMTEPGPLTLSGLLTETTTTYPRTVDSSTPGLLASFIGPGTISLDVTATAFSSFFSSSGNGTGQITTKANATVTVQYLYTQAIIPEPSSLILLTLGLGGGLVASRWRRRPTHPAASDCA